MRIASSPAMKPTSAFAQTGCITLILRPAFAFKKAHYIAMLQKSFCRSNDRSRTLDYMTRTNFNGPVDHASISGKRAAAALFDYLHH